MRKRPFRNCSKFITGGSFKQEIADMFSLVEEPEKKVTSQPQTKAEKSSTLKELEKSYEKILKNKTLKKKELSEKPYIIVHKTNPSIFFISFNINKSKAMWEALSYYKKSYHPYFIGMKELEIRKDFKIHRLHELDDYQGGKPIPIPTLLKKTNVELSCSVCGRHHFTYEDYCKNLCFVIEDTLNALPNIKGYVVCYTCYKKYFK